MGSGLHVLNGLSTDFRLKGKTPFVKPLEQYLGRKKLHVVHKKDSFSSISC